MKKSLIALAVLAASGAAMAQSSVTLYGIADLAVVKEKGESATMASGGVNTSRWGLKGSEDLGGGLKANFTFEQGVDLTSGAASGFNRQAWVGLSGGFGEVKLGKTWNAYDDIVGATSPLFDSAYLTTNNFALSYALEAGNPNKGVYYATPSFGGVSGAVSTTFKEGDDNARVNAFHVKYEGGPVFVGFAYEQQKSDLGDLKLSRLQGSYDLGAAKLLASYGQVKDLSKDYTLGVDVPLSAALTLSAGYTQSKLDGTDLKPGTVGVAAHYALSKRTSVYTGFNKDNKDAGDGNRFALGLKHTF
ncbi:porin [Hydrogenophaga electricum]|uniref:Porin n=1 Tax=Hydrogenophaga electricum TaxID=1230953 RepID=A0ABQ6CAN6_9BURK|nr:porin [Hydrogenophaga electricum]GLS15764.1 porin [Hydrogenophaga electricum]